MYGLNQNEPENLEHQPQNEIKINLKLFSVNLPQ